MNKKVLKILIRSLIILGLIGGFTANAFANQFLNDGTEYCLNSYTELNSFDSRVENSSFSLEQKAYFYQNQALNGRMANFYLANSFSCLEKQGWMNALSVVKISVNTGFSIATACTLASGGSTLPLVIGMGVSSLVTDMAQITLSNMPCEDTRNEQKIQKQIEETICKIATKQSGTCDLNNIEFEYKRPNRSEYRAI
ncbi:MAG: hypothetical protein VX642_09590 [Bdellovibrionota bacterium]|nr:hypothetical protein [Bdellovibrionota bacterium]